MLHGQKINVMNKETNRRRYCSGNTKNALHRHTKGLFRRGLEERSQ